MNLRSIENAILAGEKLSEKQKTHLASKAKDYWEYHPDVTINFPKWKKNIAWVAGYQDFDYNKKLNKTLPYPLAGQKKKIIFNRLKVFVRTLLAKMAGEVHHAGVIPVTSDSDDIESARLGTRVVEALKEKLKTRNIELTLKLWLILINRFYLRMFWNEDDFGITGYQNEIKRDSESGEILYDEESGEALTTEKRIPTKEPGDVGLEAVNPFMCRNDPLYTSRNKWRWFEYGEVVDAEALEEKYGVEEGTLKGETDSLATPWDIEISGTGEASIIEPDKKEDVMGRTALRIDFWTPRIFAIISDGKILDYGINKRGKIPFIRGEEKLIPIENTEKGLNLNDSIVRDGITIQREFNKFRTIVSKAIARASKIKYLLPLNTIMNKKQWNTEMGVFIDYSPSHGKPEQLKMDALPPYTELYLNTLERDFETAFSTHEASFGRLPERASHASGALVHILLEQDEVILTPMLQAIDDALGEAWSFILEMVQDNYEISRLLKYAGKDGEYSVMSFRGAQLRGNTDVKVVSQSGLPKGRIARVEYLIKMKQEGLITPQQTLELLEFGQAERIWETNLAHKNKARRENLTIEKNPDITPEETQKWVYKFDDHMTHLPIHVEDRLSGRYDKYKQNQKDALDIHIEATFKMFILLQAQMAQAQSPAPGAINEEPEQIATSEEPGTVEPSPIEEQL